MITKIFANQLYVLVQPRPFSLSNNYLFCTNNNIRQQFHPLRNKIMDLSSFQTFTEFFNNKKEQFDATCYTTASRTLAKILIDEKPAFYPQHRQLLKKFLQSLSAINFDSINHVELSHALYLLRILKCDPNNNNIFAMNYIRTILARAQNKIKQLQNQTNLNRLAYYYQQLTSLKTKSSGLIVKRLLALLQNENAEVDSPVFLSISDMTLILKGMRSKDFMTFEQVKLLKIIVNTVIEKHIMNISFFELSQISVGLNEVVQNNGDNLRQQDLMQKIQQIHKKVLSNIDQMDQKSIMYILSSIKTKNQTYIKIYKTIFEKIFDEISVNGESSFNQIFTLRLFNGISNKLGLYYTNEVNQEKFFLFLKNTVTKTPRYFNNFVEQYIEKNFFSYKHLIRIVDLLETIQEDFTPRLSFLYELSSRNINIEKLINFDRTNVEVKDKYLLILGAIAENQSRRASPNQQKFQQILKKLRQRFVSIYKVQDNTFSRFIQNTDQKYLPCLRVFRQQITQTFPNPFQTQQTPFYKKSWLKSIIHSQNEIDFMKHYVNQLKGKINVNDIQILIKSLIHDNIEHKQSVTNTLILISKNIELFKDKPQNLDNISRFFTQIFQTLFQDNNWDLARSRYWYILTQVMQKNTMQIFLRCFYNLLRKILKSQTAQTFYSERYLTFLEKLVKLNASITSKPLINDFMSEGFRLNIITREVASSLAPHIKQSLRTNDKLILQMIEKNQFALEGVELKRQNLYLFLSNPCPEVYNLIKVDHDKIVQIIEGMRFNEIWNCISHYRLGNKRQSMAILEELFKAFNKFNIVFEKYNPSYVATILRKNYVVNVFQKIDNIKSYFRKALQYYALDKNMDKITFQNHIYLIKDANDFKVRNQQYLHSLLDRLPSDNTNVQKQLYSLVLSMGLELKQSELNKLIKRDFYTFSYSSFGKCIQMFILLENKLPNASECLTKIIQKYNFWKEKNNQKMAIYALNYEYLKKKYPEETKNWVPNHVEKADLFKSLQQHNENYLFDLRKVIQECCGVQWQEHILHNNYFYKFRNLAIIFPTVSKFLGDNEAYKRIMQELTGNERVVILNRKATNIKTTLKYLITSNANTFTPQQQQKLFKKVDELYQSRRDQSNTDSEPIQTAQSQENIKA